MAIMSNMRESEQARRVGGREGVSELVSGDLTTPDRK